MQPANRPSLDAICAGHICLDITPGIPDVGYQSMQQIFRPGGLMNIDEATITPGGPVPNTGIAMAKLGAQTAFMCRVGNDEFGRITVDFLRKLGKTDGISIVPGISSSYTIILAPHGIDRMFLHHMGPNTTFSIDDINQTLLKQARLFHLGYPPSMHALIENNGKELALIFEMAKAAGLTTSLDMSLPDPNSFGGMVDWITIFENTLPFVDIFLPSIEEVIYCLDRNYFDRIYGSKSGPELIDEIPRGRYSSYAEQLLTLGCKIVGLKAAHQGMYLRTAPAAEFTNLGAAFQGDVENWAQRELWCPAFLVHQYINSIGAGDAAISGFLVSLLKHQSIEQAMKTAVCTGYQNLHTSDAFSGIKSWEETQALIASGSLILNTTKNDTNGWYWDKVTEIWSGPNDRMIIC